MVTRVLWLIMVAVLIGPAPQAMACTCATILDTYNRTDEGPPPSASWSGPIRNGDGQHLVRSNGMGSSVDGTPANTYWATSLGADVESCLTFVATSGLTPNAGVFVRVVNPNNASTAGGYLVVGNPGSSVTQLYRLDGTTLTQLGADITTTWANGDAICLTAQGSTLTAARKPSGGAWGDLGTRTDTTYASAGYVGTWTIGGSGAALMDDFGARALDGQPAMLRSLGIPGMNTYGLGGPLP